MVVALQSAGRASDEGVSGPPLADFWRLPPERRADVVQEGIAAAHRFHFGRNRAYRRTVALRGVGEDAARPTRLLRPTAATFKSYIDVLGTPFPNDEPGAFVEWLADQLSVPLPAAVSRLRRRYGSLESLLRAVEGACAAQGLEMLTSSGTSGRASIIVRDRRSTDLTVESFYLCFQRYFGMTADHRVIFLMPRRTRIAMARMAQFSVARIGLTPDRVRFAIPFPAYPDQVRIRAGRTYRFDRRGVVERRMWHPLMVRLQERYVDPRASSRALDLLERAARDGERVLLFGSLVQMDRIARRLLAEGRSIELPPGSLVGTGGGIKELYPSTPDEIRGMVASVLRVRGGGELPLRDVYGMAEANWAAMQCAAGNYHVPPWVLAVTLDEDDEPQGAPRSTGMLAFWDPFGGGDLYPSFFKTADRVTLVQPPSGCPCGDEGAYIARESIQRADRFEEAGCAAQM